MNKRQLEQLKEHIATSGGATLTSAGKITALSAGYMVSINGYEKTVKHLTKRIINKYLKLAKAHGLYAGVWLENGFYCLDLSKNITEKQRAIYEGIKNKQRAIYEISTGAYIYLNNF